MAGKASEEEIKSEIKKVSDARSHRQGAVRQHITKLQTFEADPRVENLSNVEEQMKKLLTARSLFKDSHEAAFAVYEKYGQSTAELVKKLQLLEADVQAIYKSCHLWVTTTRKALKSDLETTIAYGASSKSSEEAAGDSTSPAGEQELDVTIVSSDERELEIENETLREKLEAREDEMYTMTEQIQDLMKRMDDLTASKRRVFELEELVRRKDKEQYEAQQKQSSELSRLTYELGEKEDELRQHKDLTSTRRMSAGFSPSREAGSFGQSMLGRDDLSTISEIVAQTNAGVMKKMLDQSQVQHKRMCTTMAIPKQELKTFDGEITAYTSFVRRFDELLGDLETTDTVKLNTLMQSCTGRAYEVIECCEHKNATEGYRLARELLKNEFGDAFLICQAWMDRIIEFPKMRTGEQMSKYASMLKSAKETLTSLGYVAEMQCTKSMRQILEKTPLHVQNKWRTKHREATEKGKRATLDEMLTVISNAAKEMTDPIYGSEVMSKLSVTPDVKPKKQVPYGNVKKKATAAAAQLENLVEEEEEEERTEEVNFTETRPEKTFVQKDFPDKEPCVMCEQGSKPTHLTARCYIYKDLSAKERLDFVREKKLCYMCLSSKHNVNSCTMPSAWKCRMPNCGARHHFTLHRGLMLGKGNDKVQAQVHCFDAREVTRGEVVAYNEHEVNSGDKIIHRVHSGRLHGDYVLPIVPVTLTEPGSFVQTHALLDTGATVTLMSQALHDRLKSKPVGMTEFSLKGVVSSKTYTAPVVDLNIKGRGAFQLEGAYNVLVIDEVEFNETHVQQLRKASKEHSHLSEVPIKTHVSNNVDLIIGQDNAHLIEPMVKVSGKHKHAPYAICTRLGWTVHGNVMEKLEFWDKWCEDGVQSECARVEFTPGISLQESLQQMWEVDKVPDVVPVSPENRRIMKVWKDEIKLKDGHLELPIPFKQTPPNLPNNYGQALSSLRTIEKRLNKDQNLSVQYIAAMRKNFDMGYAELALQDPVPGYEWYNTHLAVITDRRPGKCRIVKNASLMYRNTSLNTSVHQGPNMTANLVDISIGFRLFEVAITGDVREMYNQVHVPEQQRDCLRFLWWEDDVPGGNVVKCRMKTHMFGAVWSPAACIYAMQHTAVLFQDEYSPEVLITVVKDFYVDDWLKSVVSVPIGLRLVRELREMLSRTGFVLTKFGSNRKEILLDIPVEHRAKAYEYVDLDVEDSVVDKTLGSLWRPVEDEFGYKVEVKEKPLSRRGLLSTYSSIYDPMGYVGPYVLRAKLIVQSVCKGNGDWDEDISEEKKVEWLAWLEDLPRLAEFKVPRWLGITLEKEQQYRLHVFSDASEQGYGANVYLTISNTVSGETKSNLVISKSKVNPVSHMTVPRLELCAAVLATKLERTVKRNMEFEMLPTVFWVDSSIVLAYIKHQSKTFKTFVANRVSMIQEVTTAEQWRHVPGKLNIADVTSRGASTTELMDNKSWLNGPEFLRSEDEWPSLESEPVDENELSLERKKMKVEVSKVLVEKTFHKDTVFRLLEYFSQWNRIVKSICFWRRAFVFLRTKTMKKGHIDAFEFAEATLVLVRMLQRYFITQKQIQSAGFKKLFPLTCDGLYRIGGRLTYSKLTFEEKHPLLLPRCKVTEMFVRLQHVKTGHSGVDRTYYEVRRYFWIIGGKAVVQKVVGRCIDCQKFRKKAAQQVMAPLPAIRVTAGKAPFENVGMDLFGPVVVRIGRSDHKRWCCLITCFATRAGHIEVLPDLSTSSFIDGLTRFIARRGRPDMIITDNGTNFVGAVRELSEMVKQWNLSKIGEYFRENMIRWQFNTPTASHHGGTWERMNRTARELMMKIVKNQVLSEYALLTVCCLIEGMLNSRPLTKLNEDSSELLPLTPNHLLLGRKAQGMSGNFQKGDTLRRKWRQVQYLADEFWRRWSHEYVDTLQSRQKWLDKKVNFKVGDLVLEVKENLYRPQWPLAIVIQVFPGKDGFVRSVKIRTQTGEYERPITKLVRLENDE